MKTTSKNGSQVEASARTAWERVREAKAALEMAIAHAEEVVGLLVEAGEVALACTGGGAPPLEDEAALMEEARQRAAAHPFLNTSQRIASRKSGCDSLAKPSPSTGGKVVPSPAATPRALTPELNSRFNRVLARVFAADAETSAPPSGAAPASEKNPASALAFTPAEGTPETGKAKGNVQLNFTDGGFSSQYKPAKAASPTESDDEEAPSVALPS